MIYGIKEHPELEILRKNWKSIRFEFFNYPKENYVYWRDAIFYDDKYKDSVRGKWEVIMLKHDGEYQDECIKHFPITLEVLKQIKTANRVFFSILYPKSKLRPHDGKSGKRGQLGIVSDDKSPFCVGNESKILEEGEILVFDNENIHWIEHLGNIPRVVLVYDFEEKLDGI
jgi:aspartyl/asparaginyl beta-hydroxylase (cupin superfamily)